MGGDRLCSNDNIKQCTGDSTLCLLNIYTEFEHCILTTMKLHEYGQNNNDYEAITMNWFMAYDLLILSRPVVPNLCSA